MVFIAHYVYNNSSKHMYAGMRDPVGRSPEYISAGRTWLINLYRKETGDRE